MSAHQPTKTRVLSVVRLVAGLLGAILLVIALSTLFYDKTDSPSTRIFFGALILVCGTLLLSFATGVKSTWVLVWALGWFLSIGAAAQVPYSYYGFTHAVYLSEKFASLIWALVSPLQMYWGVKAIKLARRASTPKFGQLPPSDPRAPILFLRPFRVDSKTSRVRTGKEATSLAFNTRTEEELIAEIMSEIGPCVAVGRPDERLPQLGFNRIYVSDDKWQKTVLEHMMRAQLVILMVGSSRSFSWELQKAVELVKPERLLFLIPSDPNDVRDFIRVAQTLLPHPPPDIPRRAIFPAVSFCAVLYFEPDWTPHYAIPDAPGHFRQTLAQKITPTLRMALRPVYAQLGLEWERPPIVLPRILYEGTAAVVVLDVLGILFLRFFVR